MYNFERLRNVLKKRQEAKFRLLKREVRHMRDNIERALEMFFESSTSKAQVSYSGLEMH